MARPNECNSCLQLESCKRDRYLCNAMEELYRIYDNMKLKETKDILKKLRIFLEIEDVEPSHKMEKLAKAIISKHDSLQFINDFDIKIGYLMSYEEKVERGKLTFGKTIKLKKEYQAYLPFDFIIIFYDKNICTLTENQKKVLMFHELNHIGINQNTLRTTYKVTEHDVEDFHSVLDKHGNRWSELGSDVMDILRE